MVGNPQWWAMSAACAALPATPPPVDWQSLIAPPGPNPMTLSTYSAEPLLNDGLLAGKYGKRSRLVGFADGADLTEVTILDSENQPHTATAVIVETLALPKFTVALNAERAAQGQGGGNATGVAVTLLLPGAGNSGSLYLNCVRMEVPAKCSTEGQFRSIHLGVAFSGAQSPSLAHADLLQLKAVMEAEIDDDGADYYLNPNITPLLPSGTPMPRSTSPYQLCRDKFGGRPDPTGLTDPCDKAVTELARCIYDAKCDWARALEKSRRSTIVTGVGGAGLFGGALLLCFGPIGWGTLLTGVVIGASTYTVHDGAQNAIESCEDARAALDRIPGCWKVFTAAMAPCQ
ncbi:MAG: hypothetical protein K2Q09_03870 [Phycisphaerales bacterium]|nr:hypothetical protein [Phycisphaerales bacterium]